MAPGHPALGREEKPPGAAGTANLATHLPTRRTSTTVRDVASNAAQELRPSGWLVLGAQISLSDVVGIN